MKRILFLSVLSGTILSSCGGSGNEQEGGEIDSTASTAFEKQKKRSFLTYLDVKSNAF